MAQNNGKKAFLEGLTGMMTRRMDHSAVALLAMVSKEPWACVGVRIFGWVSLPSSIDLKRSAERAKGTPGCFKARVGGKQHTIKCKCLFWQ